MDFLVLSIAVLSLFHHAITDSKRRNFLNFRGTQRFENIIQSPNDNCQYRGLILENQFKVLLISDPTANKAAAALSVSAGSLNEDKDIPGLAHLLEHMLFLGSKKYPRKNEFAKLVSENTGIKNTHTLDHSMSYYFEISPDQLVPALDRFAQFFLEPLLEKSAMQKEIMTIHSEYEKNISKDFWRIYLLEKSWSKQDHPYNNFPIGNQRTLEETPRYYGISVHKRLLKFYSDWYSANLMHMALLGRESLDELEEVVVMLFGDVKNKNVQRSVYKDHPYGPEQLRHIFYVVPIDDVKLLKIVFPTSDVTDQYKTSPQRYLSHLLSHQGPGSIFSTLREKELGNNLWASLSDTTPIFPTAAPGFSFFYIIVHLTEAGVNAVSEIITVIFQYIKLLKTRGIQKWIYEELKKIKEIEFLFSGKIVPSTRVLWLSSLMADIPFEDILTAHLLFDEWEPKYIENLLSFLTPDNMTVIVQSKSFEDIANRTGHWFTVQHRIERLPTTLIQKWNDVELSENLHLPKPNEFIPANFDMYPRNVNEPKTPYVLHKSTLSRIWFKHDDEFKQPTLELHIEISSPVSSMDPFNRNLTEMFVLLLGDSLSHYSYDASIAKLTWTIETTEYGIKFYLSGFNEKMPMLLEKILSEITNFKIDQNRFESIKKHYIRWLKNGASRKAYWEASFYLQDLLVERGWTRSSLLNATKAIRNSIMEKFVPKLFSKIFIQGLIHGNCNKEKAMNIVNILESSLKSPFRVLPQQLVPNRQLKIEDGQQLSYEVFDHYYSCSCYYVYFQCSTESALNNAIIELFLQIVNAPCISILRTEEQLNDSVQCSIYKFGGVQGLVIRIHSEMHPLYSNSRVEIFLRTVHKMLQDMTNKELEVHKTSLVTRKLVKPERLSQLTNKYWSEISSQMYNFDRDQMEIKQLQKLKKEDILNFFEEFLHEAAYKRRKMSINIISKLSNPDRPTDVPDNAIRIEDITRFKSSSSFLPLPKPYINLAPMGTKRKRSYFANDS